MRSVIDIFILIILNFVFLLSIDLLFVLIQIIFSQFIILLYVVSLKILKIIKIFTSK